MKIKDIEAMILQNKKQPYSLAPIPIRRAMSGCYRIEIDQLELVELIQDAGHCDFLDMVITLHQTKALDENNPAFFDALCMCNGVVVALARCGAVSCGRSAGHARVDCERDREAPGRRRLPALPLLHRLSPLPRTENSRLQARWRVAVSEVGD
jgi:hypothetical protein